MATGSAVPSPARVATVETRPAAGTAITIAPGSPALANDARDTSRTGIGSSADSRQIWLVTGGDTESGPSRGSGRGDLTTVDVLSDLQRAPTPTGDLVVTRIDDSGEQRGLVHDRVIAAGFDADNRFNVVVAADSGVILARRPDGELFRHRFDPARRNAQLYQRPGEESGLQ